MDPYKIAIVHDWLIDKGGAESVLEAIFEFWPLAPVYTIVSDPTGQCQTLLENRQVQNSFISKLPRAKSWYRYYLPLMPLAIEQFDLGNFDIIFSSSYAVAKGVITGPNQLHISYVHSPIRYAWDMQHQYLNEAGLNTGIRSILVRWMLHYIRNWDIRTANGVDHFITNSNFIARRIWKVYRREATVIHPPVDVAKFTLKTKKDNYYITASRIVSYKKIDLIVDTFSAMPDKKLIVIGSGPDFEKIKRSAGPNVELMGYQSFDVLKQKMQQAKAFVFAAEEDFGIVPLEAQACGTPVIAYGKGGALETIINGKTGIFFKDQSVESLREAILRFEEIQDSFDPEILRENAESFNKERFQKEIKAFLDDKWEEFSTR